MLGEIRDVMRYILTLCEGMSMVTGLRVVSCMQQWSADPRPHFLPEFGSQDLLIPFCTG